MTNLFIGRITNFARTSQNFEILHILSLLNKLKNGGIRGRKRFGFLIKLIPTSTGFDRISHSLVQKIFSFENLHFQKWLVNSPILRLYISPFLEKCLMLSPPQLICGYSLPLLRLQIRSDLFKRRLSSSAIDYGPLFTTRHILHSIGYLHWNPLPTSETVITLANLINDFDELIDMDDEYFSIGNLVMWLSELGIRHDPLLEKLEDYLLSNEGVNSSRDYIRTLLVSRGEVEIEGDALVSFRQTWPEDGRVSLKKLGNMYYWYKGRYKLKPALSLGMDRLSNVDLCKIVAYGHFETPNIMEAVVYDYSYGSCSSSGYRRSFDSVDPDLYGRFLLELSRTIHILPEVSLPLVKIAAMKFGSATIRGRSAMLEAVFNMGPFAWTFAGSFATAQLDLKSLSYLHLMQLMSDSVQPPTRLFNKLASTTFSGLLLTPPTQLRINAPTGFRTRTIRPSPVPVYDRSTLHNYKLSKLKRRINIASQDTLLQATHINKASGSHTETLSATRTALLAITASALLGNTISDHELPIISRLVKHVRYVSTPYSKIDQSYTLWTSAPTDDYKRKLQSQLNKVGEESIDPRYTAIHTDLALTTSTAKKGRSKSNKAMDKPFGVQKQLEYFEEYLHRMSSKGLLLHETRNKEHTTTSSLESHVYQTLLYITLSVQRQISAGPFTIDFVILQDTKQ